jgi:uncharacterized protein YqgV (UPF0045/DUF77 family)
MLVEIQCLASPPGTPDDAYAHIDAAIAVVAASGLRFEVGALGTTVEGEPDDIWPLLRRVHEACLVAGADRLVSVIKVEQSTSDTPPTIDSLTAKHR